MEVEEYTEAPDGFQVISYKDVDPLDPSLPFPVALMHKPCMKCGEEDADPRDVEYSRCRECAQKELKLCTKGCKRVAFQRFNLCRECINKRGGLVCTQCNLPSGKQTLKNGTHCDACYQALRRKRKRTPSTRPEPVKKKRARIISEEDNSSSDEKSVVVDADVLVPVPNSPSL